MRDELTLKQQRFVTAFLQTANATESARRAGYKGNDVTLAAVGYENLRKAQIKKMIEDNVKKALTAEEVLQTSLGSQTATLNSKAPTWSKLMN